MTVGKVASWVWNEDQFQEQAFIPVEDRGFRYGMSVFETVAVVGRKAILAAEHLHRLELAAAQLEFPIDHAALTGMLDFLKHPPLQEGLLRIHWTAGEGGPADPIFEGRLIVRCEEMLLPGSLAPVRDLSVVTLAANFDDLDGWKTGNYLKRCRLLAAAYKRGADEALLWNHAGLLVGAVMANVFLIADSGRLATPQLQLPGCRNGTVREWVVKHHEVEERDIPFTEVLSAKEILLTNSRLGVASVMNLEARKLEKGEISRRVENSYKEFLLSQNMSHARRA